ncbi:MAG: hypothetical protein ACKOS8_03465 [Gemmataceae bacterium]
MSDSPLNASGQRRITRLAIGAVLVSVPVTAGVAWMVTPRAKPADLALENRIVAVRSAASTNIELGIGAQVSLPAVESWLNSETGKEGLGRGLTVLDFTTLW